MRTEEELRDSFDHLAGTAPLPGNIREALGRGDRRAAHRRTALVVVTAVATATTAVAAVLTPHLLASGNDSANRDAKTSAWARWAGMSLPKNVNATTQVFGANRQDTELDVVNGTPWPTFCQLQVHRNGDFDPGRIPPGSPTIDIRGQKARIVTSLKNAPFPPEPGGYRFRIVGDKSQTLVWQPVEGLWALLTCESQRRLGTLKVPTIDGPFDPNPEVAVTIAKSMSANPEVLGSPFVADDLPDGLTARRITYSPAKGNVAGSGEDFAVMFSDGDPATGYVKPTGPVCSELWRPGSDTNRCTGLTGNPAYLAQVGDDIEIRYSTSKFWNQYSRYRKPDAIIHGMKAYYTYAGGVAASTKKGKIPPLDAVTLEGNGVAVTIHSLAPEPSIDKLRTIAEHLQLTSTPTNPATWFDAANAIP